MLFPALLNVGMLTFNRALHLNCSILLVTVWIGCVWEGTTIVARPHHILRKHYHHEHEGAGRLLRGKSRNVLFVGGSHRHYQMKQRGNSDLMSLEHALQRLPAKVGTLVAAFQQAPDEEKAKSIVTILSGIFKYALSVEDNVGLDCADKLENLTQEVTTLRNSLEAVDGQLTQTSGRMRSLQVSLDHLLAEIESARSHYDSQRQVCEQHNELYREAFDALSDDVLLVADIVAKASTWCASGSSPPALIECTMPNGDVIATFKDGALRAKAEALSGNGERLLSVSLDEALRRPSKHGESFLSLGSKSNLVGHQKQVPEYLCTDAPAPSCPDFLDAMASFRGAAEDAIEELDADRESEVAHCEMSLASYDSRVRSLKEQTDNANLALADAVDEQGSLAELRLEVRLQLQRAKDKVYAGNRSCAAQVAEAIETQISSRRVWKELLLAVPGQRFADFSGNCEVTGWLAGPCSQPCGEGGVRNYTRQVVSEDPRHELVCPTLQLQRSCSWTPCSVDAKAAEWGEWSQCSHLCGGGTRTRQRTGLRAAEFSGIQEVVQEEVCNPNPCDPDCELSSWTSWSSCSKACMTGTRVRYRHVLRHGVGKGECPSPDSPKRQQFVPCNQESCANLSNEVILTPHCMTTLDLVFVLDGSGSMGQDGFEGARVFLSQVASRTLLDSEAPVFGSSVITPSGWFQSLAGLKGAQPRGAQIGLVTFGASARAVQDLTSVRSNLARSFVVEWPGKVLEDTATNTAGALAVARQLFERSPERPGATPVVVVLTNGPPNSGRLMGVEAKRLLDLGIRLLFVTVGSTVDQRSLERLVTPPARENLVHVKSFGDLATPEAATRLLANICPTMVLSPDSATRM